MPPAKYTPEKLLSILPSKVRVEPNGCWTWLMAVNENGYGSWRVNDKAKKAHRVSYELRYGKPPQGMDLDHKCHDPKTCAGGKTCPHRRCVNPDHLEPVDRSTNIKRGTNGLRWDEKAVVKEECPFGHKFTEENTYIFRDRRHCRRCSARRVIECRQRKRLLNASAKSIDPNP